MTVSIYHYYDRGYSLSYSNRQKTKRPWLHLHSFFMETYFMCGHGVDMKQGSIKINSEVVKGS